MGQDRFLTFSRRGDGKDFLYYGVQSNNLSETKIEGLFDLTELGASNQLTEITDGGETYTDSCSGNTVDYWGDYYAGNGHGLRNVRPRVGKFRGDYFYRAAFGILDVHVVTIETPTLTVTGPAEGCPDPEITSQFAVTAIDCSPQPPSSAYQWAVDGGGGQILANGGSTVDISWAAPGAADVTVTNPDCEDATGSAEIVIQDPTDLGFTGPVTSVPEMPVVDELTQFHVDTSAGTALWQWDFGDGTVETYTNRTQGENPTHVFSQSGPVTVTVSIADCLGEFFGQDSTLDLEIAAEPPVVDEFQARDCNILGFCDFCAGDPIVFDQEFSGNPTLFEYDWDGDGTYDESFNSVGPTITHTYTMVMPVFFPRVRISAGGGTPAVFVHEDPFTMAQCGAEFITVSGPQTLEVNEPGLYTATAFNCAPAADGWSWEATGGGQISGDVDSNQVTVTWSTEGTKAVDASNSACGQVSGGQTVEVAQPSDLIFIDGFESGDVSVWSSAGTEASSPDSGAR